MLSKIYESNSSFKGPAERLEWAGRVGEREREGEVRGEMTNECYHGHEAGQWPWNLKLKAQR